MSALVVCICVNVIVCVCVRVCVSHLGHYIHRHEKAGYIDTLSSKRQECKWSWEGSSFFSVSHFHL